MPYVPHSSLFQQKAKFRAHIFFFLSGHLLLNLKLVCVLALFVASTFCLVKCVLKRAAFEQEVDCTLFSRQVVTRFSLNIFENEAA